MHHLMEAMRGKAHCDECGGPVSRERIERSKINGIPQGPFLCDGCEVMMDEQIQSSMLAREHEQMREASYFERICEEADPALAEAIHRATRGQ